ncbi:MAG: serine hydrolase [Gemmatimonadetes bacterium]|nr:serine hydrolase [Gemmatimonadota bacterium]
MKSACKDHPPDVEAARAAFASRRYGLKLGENVTQVEIKSQNRFLAVLAVALMVNPLSGQAPPGADSVWTDIVSQWQTAVTEEGIVGASLGLVVDGALTKLETRGSANLSEGRPVDPSTIYHWASITKTFTAIGIMQLRDRGLLRLDDPIVKYVPELRDVHNEYGSMEDITIRQLMSHSAGFRAGTWPWGTGEDWQPHEPTEWSQLVAMIPYTQIEFEPGSKFSYSNPGIIFLGKVIEKLSGDVYEAYIDKNIFRPLGMRRAYFDMTPWGLLRFRSNHYFVEEGRVTPGGLDFNTGITVANGGLNAPVDDMARYLAFLMGSRLDGSDYDAVLGRSSLTEMWKTVVPIGDTPWGASSMGLSYFLYEKDGNQIVGHTGGQRGFISFIYFDPIANVGAISAFNTLGLDDTGPDTRRMQGEITERLVNELFPLFRDRAAAASDGR